MSLCVSGLYVVSVCAYVCWGEWGKIQFGWKRFDSKEFIDAAAHTKGNASYGIE